MKLAGNLLTGFVAVLHIGIMILEMFFWDHPVGRKIFSMTPEVSELSATLAMNQGFYNGLLAAGLFWGLWHGKRDFKLFFLGCVVAAGVFGSATAKFSILFTQAMPAFIAFVCVYLTKD